MTADEPGHATGGHEPASFVDADLRGARFVRADLSGAVMRAVDVGGADIDAPWLLEDDDALRVNGVDVVPYVRAELERRFPGRASRTAGDPEGLRAAWAAVEAAWEQAVERAGRLDEAAVDVRVDGEWSFAETVRHLVMATDTWLGRAVLEQEPEQAYHPLGMPNAEFATDGYDMAVFPAADAGTTPPYADVLTARAERQAMVRDLLERVDADVVAVPRANPWAPQQQTSTLRCLHVILNEEWEHLRYATRDLETLERRSASGEGPLRST